MPDYDIFIYQMLLYLYTHCKNEIKSRKQRLKHCFTFFYCEFQSHYNRILKCEDIEMM